MTKQDQNFLAAFKQNGECGTYIIAEAGVHHNCSIETAKNLIDAASQSGADAVKFQTYKADTLVTYWAPTYWKQDVPSNGLTQFEYFKNRDKFGFDDYKTLYDYARHKGITFCSTPFDEQAVGWLDKIGVPFWKIASADIDNYPLLEAVALTEKPVILSTGAAYFDEIDNSVCFLRSKGVKQIALLHCNLAYPTPDNEANLNRIPELKKRFPNILVGYSDHTIPDNGVIIPVLAVTLGAKIIEKHFTLNRNLPEDDHYHALDPPLLKKMIQRISIAENATSRFREITASESSARQNARRSLVAKDDIPSGTVLKEEMLIPKRPGGGIPPSLLNDIVGRKTIKAIGKDMQLTEEFLE